MSTDEDACIIRTERFVLRPFAASDAPRLVELCRDKAVAWNTSRIPHPYTRADADAFIARRAAVSSSADECAFAICENGEIIGGAGLHFDEKVGCLELGYWIGADYRGKGAATEAARALVAFARDTLGVAALTAGYFLDNPASGAVLKKAGFRDTGARVMYFSRGRGVEVESTVYRIEFDDKER